MPTDDVAYVAAGSKPSKKSIWKEKLFFRDKGKGTSDQQIDDFLNTPTAPNPASSTPPPPPPPPPQFPSSASSDALPAPTLPNLAPIAPVDIPPRHSPHSHYHGPSYDLSYRRSPAQHSPYRSDLSTPPPLYKPSPSPSADPYGFPSSFKSRPNKKRTNVKFTQSEPELIGEGGDECDIPPTKVSASRGRSSTLSSVESDYISAYQDSAAPSIGDGPWGRRQKHLSIDDHDPLASLDSAPGRRISFRASEESNSFARNVRTKMQAEEGQALHEAVHSLPMSSSNDEDRDDFPPVSQSPGLPYSTTPPSAGKGYINTSPYRAYSKPAASDATRLDTAPPQNVLPVGAAAQRLRDPPEPKDIAPDVYQRPSSRENIGRGYTNSSPSRTPQPPLHQTLPLRQQPDPQTQQKMSIRSIATQFGVSAFDELRAYLAQYMDLFATEAEYSKPLMETSLSEWLRASAWWFLRGKKGLEAYARPRSGAAGNAQAAMQAMLDLGKALWINTDIVPHHHELEKYGEMSLDTVFAISTTTGDTRLSSALGQHQTVMNALRTLSISVKRNNIIAALHSGGTSVEHADISIWVHYPVFAPDVSAVLSGLTSRSILLDSGRAATTSGGANMMLVGDTSHLFSYGTLFVDVSVSSHDDDDDPEEIILPCILSILRERSDWYVFAAITSQNELVNVLIQSDRKNGPTWKDVRFDVGSHSMRVKLPRGFSLHVTFNGEDFKMLWNIVHYTQKTEGSLQPMAGETAIFTTVLKALHYVDPGPVKAFPTEPSENCKVRLFERTVTVSHGSGTRNAHRGFRLAFVTDPKVKTLSHVEHILGQEAPIVFGLLRGEDGVPALMLQVTEDGRTRSMLLGFHDVEERAMMHSLLLGMAIDEGEVKTASDLSIRSYSVEEPPSPGAEGPQPARPSVLHFPVGNVSVIDEENVVPTHSYGPTIMSEHLRIFVASEFGSVADRINLGKYFLMLGLLFFQFICYFYFCPVTDLK